MSGSLLIRADASVAIGTGHVMRCLAIAQAWRRSGHPVLLAQAETTSGVRKRLQAEGVATAALPVERGGADDANQTIEHARQHGARWVIADGYRFESRWQEALRRAGLRLLLVDDYGQADGYRADIVLNQNLSANASLYARRDPETRLLLGPTYALLREDFSAAPTASEAEVARKILVTLGGSDPENITAKVVGALLRLEAIEVIVVVGGSNPHLESLTALVARHPFIQLRADATNMPELMAWADIAVSAAGSTVWELAHMGTPALLIVVADNQKEIARALHEAGVGLNLGWHRDLEEGDLVGAINALSCDAERRATMSRKSRALVDGRGVERVLEEMRR